MIEYIKITNFGPIKDEVELNFESGEKDGFPEYEVKMPDGKKLLKLMYIYGPNASGKSTILEAFQFLFDLWRFPLSNKDINLPYNPFYFTPPPHNSNSSIKISFYNEGIRYKYYILFNVFSVIEEKLEEFQTRKSALVFIRKTDPTKRLTTIQFGSKYKLNKNTKEAISTSTLHNNSVFGGYKKINIDFILLEKLDNWISEYFINVIRSFQDLNDASLKLLKEEKVKNTLVESLIKKADIHLSGYDLIDPLKNNNEINHETAQLYLKHTIDENTYLLPFQNESDGTKRFFCLATLISKYALMSNGFVIIDEMNSSLHPDLVLFLLSTFLLNSKKTSQMLISTHDISFLEEDIIRRDALWFTEKKKNGSIELYSALDFDSSVLRKSSNIMKAYKIGKLGAKPNLGSPYILQK